MLSLSLSLSGLSAFQPFHRHTRWAFIILMLWNHLCICIVWRIIVVDKNIPLSVCVCVCPNSSTKVWMIHMQILFLPFDLIFLSGIQTQQHLLLINCSLCRSLPLWKWLIRMFLFVYSNTVDQSLELNLVTLYFDTLDIILKITTITQDLLLMCYR